MEAFRKHVSASIVIGCLSAPILWSCSGTGKNSATDTTYVDEYHADHDIAMTLSSITDAIRVGEPLDSTDYDFSGILTDGQGHPLYTDVQGLPGKWDIDVINPTQVEISNIALGDLLPADLESYITATLGLSGSNIIEIRTPEENDNAELTIYDFNGGFLRIETRTDTTSSGLEAPRMHITISRNYEI